MNFPLEEQHRRLPAPWSPHPPSSFEASLQQSSPLLNSPQSPLLLSRSPSWIPPALPDAAASRHLIARASSSMPLFRLFKRDLLALVAVQIRLVLQGLLAIVAGFLRS